MRLALAVVGLLAVHGVANAICALPVVGSGVITPADAKLAADGGVLVQTVIGGNGPAVGADNAVNKSWRFSDGKTQGVPTLVTLAPGLVVYRPPAGFTGTLSLMDAKVDRRKVTFTADTPALLPAPELTSIKYSTIPLRRGGFIEQVNATFKTAAPTGAIAVVVYGVTKKGNVARSWGTVAAGATTAHVAGTASRCNAGIPGEVVSKVGHKVVLAWVDAHGRVSALSKPVVITRGK